MPWARLAFRRHPDEHRLLFHEFYSAVFQLARLGHTVVYVVLQLVFSTFNRGMFSILMVETVTFEIESLVIGEVKIRHSAAQGMILAPLDIGLSRQGGGMQA